MPNTERKIFEALREILKANVTLAAYVKNVLDGDRDNIPEEGFPAIILEPEFTREEHATVNRRHMMNVGIQISCVAQHYDFDKQIVGDGTVKGVYDFATDVKNAIDAYPQLNYDATGARVDRYLFRNTDYVREFLPFRIANILFEGQVMTTGATR